MKTLPAIGSQTVSDEILKSFLHSTHSACKHILAAHIMRHNGTESHCAALRAHLGGEVAFEHYNTDTLVSNGRVLIALRRFKHPAAEDLALGFSFPAEWFWCFDQIEANEDIEPGTFRGVPADVLNSLAVLPDLQWIKIKRVNFFTHGKRGSKPGHRPAPGYIRFFKFTGGLGVAVSERK